MRISDCLGAVEAILFASADPVTVKQVVEAMEGQVDASEALSLLEELRQTCDSQSRGVQLERVAEGFRFSTRASHAPFVRNFLKAQNLRRLSQAAVECLAIVAYKQPVTGAEVSSIRSTESSAVLRGLLEKKLVRISGRKNVVGRPLLYTTTKEFLIHFGLESLEDLPTFRELNEVFREEVRQESLFRQAPAPPSAGTSPGAPPGEAGGGP